MTFNTISLITGREILNANGKPTVEATIKTNNMLVAVASVPSGTSTGTYEAYELYDGGKRYGGYGTRVASSHVSHEINEALNGMSLENPAELDRKLIALDGTANKSRLGANAILATSVAIHKAHALVCSKPVYKSLIPQKTTYRVPDIIATVISGGAFSPSGLEFEDYLYILSGFDTFSDELEALVTLRKALEKNLKSRFGEFPEDGGALAAPLATTRNAFDVMLEVAKECGYEKYVSLGLDVAASEFYDADKSIYEFGNGMDRVQLCDYYLELCREYPLTFIEDGFSEDDGEGFSLLKKLRPDVQVVGDDLFVSNIERLKKYASCANGLLLKINQIGTVAEAIDAANYAKESGLDIIVSLRSGETTDDFIADLSVALSARQIKLGSPVRAERNVKYNRLLQISEELSQ